MEKTNYQYEGLNNLLTDVDYFLSTTEIDKVNVIAYNVNTSNQTPTPFLTFLLFKNHLDVMNIPVIFLLEDYYDKTARLAQYVQKELINLLNSQNYNHASCEGIEFNGIFINNNEIYMVYDLSHIEWSTYDSLVKRDHLWFALADEIINTGTICNMEIDAKATIFFLETPSFGFLVDAAGAKLEAPIAAYICKPAHKLNFTFVFGVSPSDKDNMFGPYYYFTDYRNAINQQVTDDGSSKSFKTGIIRFALFMNKTMIVDNLIDNEPDWSSTKRSRLTDDSLNANYENSTIRISDHDGNWATNYDSLFVGRVLLDNGKELQGLPMFVVKNYEQQQPLSYHLIDNKSLDERLDEYHIM
jgi:hypothetical protein